MQAVATKPCVPRVLYVPELYLGTAGAPGTPQSGQLNLIFPQTPGSPPRASCVHEGVQHGSPSRKFNRKATQNNTLEVVSKVLSTR